MDLNALLGMPELGMRLLWGKAHLARRIRRVVPTDLADPRRYLTGGELVLTGMLWRDHTEAKQFVACLAAAGVAALGAGDPDLDEIPTALVAACRRHDLPLFAVRADVAFSTITELVSQRLSAGRSGDLAAVLGRHRHLATGSGLTEVLDLVHSELGLRCRVLSPTGRLIRGTASEADQPPTRSDRTILARRALRAETLPRRINIDRDHGYSVFGIGVTAHTGWFLVTEDDHTQWPPERRAVVDELNALAGLELERLLTRPPTDTDLIAALSADADQRTLAGLLRKAGLSGRGGFAVAVTEVAGCGGARLASAVTAELLASRTARIAWAAIGSQTIAVTEVEDHPRLLRQAQQRAAALCAGLATDRVMVGVSGPAAGPEGLPGALAEARHATRVAAGRHGAVEIAGPDDLTSHVLLLSAAPAELRRAYRQRVLGPLLEYDATHHSDLVATVEQFLQCQGSWSKCAAALHLHVNTLRYRIDRIEKLTGRDLRRLTDRVDLFLALALR